MDATHNVGEWDGRCEAFVDDAERLESRGVRKRVHHVLRVPRSRHVQPEEAHEVAKRHRLTHLGGRKVR